MSKIHPDDNDLLKICNLEKRMRNSDNQDPSMHVLSFPKLKIEERKSENENNDFPVHSDSFENKEDHRDLSLENLDKENELPLGLNEEEKEFSLQNYLNLEKSDEKKTKTDGKRKASEPLKYYPMFKKVKTEEMEHKMFIDEKIGYSENSNEAFHLNSLKNNRKITEYFKKQKNFVQSLMKNEALKTIKKEEETNNTKTAVKGMKTVSKENPSRNILLRKISFGESNSNTECFNENGSQEKKLKEKEKQPKQTKTNIPNNSFEKVSNENFKLKDEIRKLNKKLVDKDAILKNEEAHLRHLVTDNKVLNEKIQVYEQQMAKTQKSQQLICKLLLETEKRKKHELKNRLISQKQRLGEFISQRQGHKFVEIWIDGSELRATKEKLTNIRNEREQIEKTKKNIKVKKNGTLNPFCIFSAKAEKEKVNNSFSFLNITGDSENPDSNSIGEPHVFDVKNRLSFKNSILLKEEQNLIEEVRRLENEKIQYIYQSKLFYEEEHSRFSKPDPETGFLAWPFINSKYQILSLLGKGGFSEVYKAFDVVNYLEVACKMHHLNSAWSENAKHQYVKHALRENEIHNCLKHPNIVKLYETFEIDSNTICTVLEYCEGPDLSQYMKQYKFLSEKDAKCILKQIIAGLKYLHENKKKIIHYDLKPQNIIFHKGEIKISDFGLCKIMEDNVTRLELTSQGVGTYWYLPPECFEIGENPPNISTKVDIWSLGVIFFEMLFGEKPFGHNMSQERILKEQVILNSDDVKFPIKPSISNECKDFISCCLIKDPEKRWDINGVINSPYLSRK